VDRGFRGLVERRRRLIEQQQRGIADDRARDRDALALPARQRVAALTDRRVVFLRQAHDVAVNLGLARRCLDLLVAGAFLAEPDVLPDRHVEQHVLLEHDRHATTQRLAGHAADIDAVDRHPPLVRRVKAQDQVEQRALARAAGTDDRDTLADAELEAEIVEHRRLAAFVGEGDAVEGDVVGDARQIGRARAIGAARRLIQQFLDMPYRRRRLDRHRNEMHQMGDGVGHLPERALEGDEGADGDLALGGEIGADRQHHEVQQQYRNGDGALHHRGEEDGGRGLDAHFLVAHGEPAQRAALQAERLDHRLRRDVFLHGAEQRRFVELLLVIRLHCLWRQDPRPDQRDREYQQGHRRELPVQKQHQDDAGDQFQERQRRAVGKRLDRTFEGRKVDREAREDFAALGAGEIRGRQVLDVLEQLVPYVGNDRRRQPRIPALIPDRDDRGDDAGDREHAEDLVERLKVLLAERVVDQEFQAQRHDDVEQRLDENAEGHEGEQLAVIAQIRPDEAVNGGHRAGGFLGGEDDEVLVIIIVVELQLVLFIVLVIVGGDGGCLAASRGHRGSPGR